MDNRVEVDFSSSSESIAFTFYPSGESFLFLGTIYDYQIINDQKQPMPIRNVDEWIRRRTNNLHSINTLLDLSATFRNGMAMSFSQADLEECSRIAYNVTMDQLYYKGYASKFASLYSIESTPMTDIKKMIKEYIAKNKNDLDYNKIIRMIRVCDSLGYDELVATLSKIPNLEGDGKLPDAIVLNEEVLSIIKSAIQRRFMRTKR